MLGVSRPSVALSAGTLQKAGLMTYARGEMRIIDRLGLEGAACEFYAVVREPSAGCSPTEAWSCGGLKSADSGGGPSVSFGQTAG